MFQEDLALPEALFEQKTPPHTAPPHADSHLFRPGGAPRTWRPPARRGPQARLGPVPCAAARGAQPPPGKAGGVGCVGGNATPARSRRGSGRAPGTGAGEKICPERPSRGCGEAAERRRQEGVGDGARRETGRDSSSPGGGGRAEGTGQSSGCERGQRGAGSGQEGPRTEGGADPPPPPPPSPPPHTHTHRAPGRWRRPELRGGAAAGPSRGGKEGEGRGRSLSGLSLSLSSPSSRSSAPRSAAPKEPPGSGDELKMASMRNRLGTRSATSSPERSRGPSRSHGSCGGPGVAIP